MLKAKKHRRLRLVSAAAVMGVAYDGGDKERSTVL